LVLLEEEKKNEIVNDEEKGREREKKTGPDR
jgi:hypothetical protein